MAVITTSAFFLSDLPSKKRVRNVEPSQPPPPLVSEPEEIINSDDHVLCRDCGRGGSISGSGGLRIALKCSFCDYGLHKHHTHARVSPYVDGDESREFCSKNCKRDWARQRIHRLSMIAGINPSSKHCRTGGNYSSMRSPDVIGDNMHHACGSVKQESPIRTLSIRF